MSHKDRQSVREPSKEIPISIPIPLRYSWYSICPRRLVFCLYCGCGSQNASLVVLQTEFHKILIDVKLAAHIRFLFVSAAAINNLL